MPISVQEIFASFHGLVEISLFSGTKRNRFAPVEFIFETPQKGDMSPGPELIVDKRVHLSPLVNACLAPLGSKPTCVKDVFSALDPLIAENYLHRENPHRLNESCLNFENGVTKLFDIFKSGYIFICKAPLRQDHLNRTFLYDIHVAVWSHKHKRFLHLCTLRRVEGDKIIPGPDWREYLDLFVNIFLEKKASGE